MACAESWSLPTPSASSAPPKKTVLAHVANVALGEPEWESTRDTDWPEEIPLRPGELVLADLGIVEEGSPAFAHLLEHCYCHATQGSIKKAREVPAAQQGSLFAEAKDDEIRGWLSSNSVEEVP